MQKSIKLGDKNIEYQVKTSHRAKNMRLSIYADGRFIVTRPYRLGDSAIECFIKQKSTWILSKIKKIGPIGPLISPAEDRKKYLRYKEDARRLVEEKVNYFNKIYSFKFNRIAIRNQKTCWGSCSRRANLNFNYKIIFLPERLADYIIVHELCHLKELNHSRHFWDLLAQSIPDYLEIRRELKKTRN
ncbi:MAG: SprT family zinc-dependent metalloprotease [Patescibacteria group bacterium]|nr:SprT family zinc-dependent metalloprotease [Patescibacteria group bacterium]